MAKFSAKRPFTTALRAYVILVLVIAAIAAPVSYAFLPLLLLAVFLIFEFGHFRPIVRLSLHLLIMLGIPLASEAVLGNWLPFLVSLPLLALVYPDLQMLAESQQPANSRFKVRPTDISLRLELLVGLVVLVALSLGKPALALVSGTLGLFIAGLAAYAWLRLNQAPLTSLQKVHRVVAGKDLNFSTVFSTPSKSAGWAHLPAGTESPDARSEGPYGPIVHPRRFSANDKGTEVSFHLKPDLAGPRKVDVQAVLFDRWGLLQFRSTIRVAELNVIPRARYAAWLAEKYLESTAAGSIPMVSAISTAKLSQRAGQGMDYYGSRTYQPGDNARRMDWKHTLKLGELIVREFDAALTSEALLLVNLVAEDAEEADRLVYKWIASAMTLGFEGIPASLALYDDESVRLVTGKLNAREIVSKSLEASRDVVIKPAPVRYLKPRDPLGLRADITRLKNADEPSLNGLVQFLDLELRAMAETASLSPCTAALDAATAKKGTQATVLFISARNHDVEAISMARQRMKSKGQTCFDIALD